MIFGTINAMAAIHIIMAIGTGRISRQDRLLLFKPFSLLMKESFPLALFVSLIVHPKLKKLVHLPKFLTALFWLLLRNAFMPAIRLQLIECGSKTAK
jgi:hypothetical protein